MLKVLIINPFGIGDVLFTTPVVRAIKDNYPESFIAYWCNQRVQGILRSNPNLNKIFPLSRGDLKEIFKKSKINGIKIFLSLIFALRKEKFDIVFDFSLDHRYGLISKILGIKRRIGLDYKNRGRFLTDKLDIEGYSNTHVIDYYLSLLKLIGISAKNNSMELFVTEADKVHAKNLLLRYGIKNSDTVIGIVAGAGLSWGKDAKFKHWPATNFVKLIDKLSGVDNIRVILLGDELEHYIADTILSSLQNKVINLVGQTDLAELIAVIDGLNVLVSNDGGPLHIAVALGVKTVSIFGPVDEKVYGPYPVSNRHIVVNLDMACRPCYHNFRLPACEYNHECINSITVEQVYSAVEKLLSQH